MRPPMSREGRALMFAAVAAALFGTLFVVQNVRGVEVPDEPGDLVYVDLYDPAERKVEVVINQGDGQAFAALAIDPLLEHPERFRAGEAEASYRAQRPLLSWLAWFGTGADAARAPVVLLALMVPSAMVLVVGAGLFARGREPLGAAVVVLSPGAMVALDWVGPEPLAAGLGLAGFAVWCPGRRGWGTALMVAAVLARESLLLVPAALIAHDLWRRRRPHPLLAVPFVVEAIWFGAVTWRFGASPLEASEGRLDPPLWGIVSAAGDWGAVDWVLATVTLAVLVLGWRRGAVPARGLIGLHAALAVVMGDAVWGRWEDFSRPLLPGFAAALVLLMTRGQGPATTPAKAPSPPSPPGRRGAPTQASPAPS